MTQVAKRVDDKTVYFSNHALDRWWERCEENEVNGRSKALRLLKQRLDESEVLRSMPPWVRDSVKAQISEGKERGFLSLDNDNGFVIVENGKESFVAVTFLSKLTEPN